jgi:uncharacterized delta-60 repeat protein/uncharacterized repeat protein (TIGR02543 family)
MYKKLLAFLAVAMFGSFCARASLLDPSFNPGTGANGLIEQSLTQQNGKILICGNFTAFNGVTNSYIARLNSDGSVDTSFNSQVGYWVRTMTLQPDGKIVIGGFFTDVAGAPRGLIARLNSDGSLDTTFNPGTGASGVLGVAVDGDADPFIFATAIQSDGKILITGNFTNYNGVNIYGIARLTTNGLLDNTFNVGSGINFASWGRSLLVQSNGQIMLTGWFQNYNNSLHDRMVRINPDGSPDTNFNPSFGLYTAVYDSVQLPNQQYVVVGDHTNTTFLENMRQLDVNGATVPSFIGSDSDKTESIRLLPNGQYLIGGYFTEVDGIPIMSIARLNSDGSLDTNFGANVDNFVWSVALQPNGTYIAVGGFQNVDGVSRNSIARFLPSTNSVTGSGGYTDGPIIRIFQPVANVTRVLTGTALVRGTVTGTNGVASVVVSVGSSAQASTGTTNWSATVTLSPGTNLVSILATDLSGKTSLSTREFVYAADEIISITNNGMGSVVPNYNGRSLRAATTYEVTAVPRPGYVFNGWTGSITSSAKVLRFIMQPGLVLQANFVPNPFLPYVGTYQGLAYNPLANTNASAGFLVLTLGPAGGYTAHLTLNGTAYAWSGVFSGSLTAQKTFTPRLQAAVSVTLQLIKNNMLTGTISNAAFDSTLTAYKPFFTRADLATNYEGQYTVLMPGGSNAVPAGDGYMAITVSPLGDAQIAGMLADGTAFVRNVPVSSNGMAPFYFSYDRNLAAAFGWLTFAATNSRTVLGSVHWEKTSSFGTDISLLGSGYTRPVGGVPVVGWTNAALALTSGGLTNSLAQTFTLEQGNHFVFSSPDTNRIIVNLNPVNGVFSGTLLDPETKRLTGFHGAVLQDQAVGSGFFLSGGFSGRLSLSVAP